MLPILAILAFTHLLVFIGGMWLGYAIKVKDYKNFISLWRNGKSGRPLEVSQKPLKEGGCL